mmetsp:Transcript_24189/g.62332  ORF Transcript_24189/g.62332 Transcript_24189/m.62332 type:complete len:361 (-) Transcript_24189:675-1757(-)
MRPSWFTSTSSNSSIARVSVSECSLPGRQSSRRTCARSSLASSEPASASHANRSASSWCLPPPTPVFMSSVPSRYSRKSSVPVSSTSSSRNTASSSSRVLLGVPPPARPSASLSAAETACTHSSSVSAPLPSWSSDAKLRITAATVCLSASKRRASTSISTTAASTGRWSWRASRCRATSSSVCPVHSTPRADAITRRTLSPKRRASRASSALGTYGGRKVSSRWFTSWQSIERTSAGSGGPASTHDGSKCAWGKRTTTGCTATPGAKAPSLKCIIAVPFVVVPSGNRHTAGPCAHAGYVARALITAATSLRLVGDVRWTGMVMSARATVPTTGMLTHSAAATKHPSTSQASASGSTKVT